MKKLILVILVLIGLMAVVAFGIGVLIAVGQQLALRSVPESTILHANLETSLVEHIPDDPIAQLVSEGTPTVLGIVETLEAASQDDRIAGLVARVGAADMSMAHVQELRDAVLHFRDSGKFAVAYAETFGEAGPGNAAYYLATAFDEIYMQPSGDIGLTGLAAESPFLRGTLDKLGIVPRGDHRYEYKNALNLFTEREYTAPHREATLALLGSFFEQMVRGIAEARSLPVEDVRRLIDRGPFYGQEAVDAGLVEGLSYRDEVLDHAKKTAGEDSDLLGLSDYRQRARRLYDRGETIALIYGVGNVVRGKSELDPFSGGTSMGSDTVAGAFRDAVEDEDVKAILFRVDSPGGSYVASDTIWRETVRAREAGKPVIVSMGSVAASGGYFVSMAADKIVAEPGTITGSIGVLYAKFLTEGLWEKTGISWDSVQTSANANLWSGLDDFTPEQWTRIQDWLDRIYEDFTNKVAQGRALPKESVLEAAKGRVWSGEDAKRLSLIDELGGFRRAIALAREAAGIAPDAPVRLKVFPEEKPIWQRLLERSSPSSDARLAALALGRLRELAQPILELSRRFALASDQGVLSMEEDILLSR
jgi:protease-4